MKTTSPHEGNLRTERMGNSSTQFFFVCLVQTFGACMHHDEETAPCQEIINKITFLKRGLPLRKICQFITL